MKIAIALAALFLSSSAFAEYSCLQLNNNKPNGFNATINGDTITLTGITAPAASVKRNPSYDSKNGFKAFTGVSGCVSVPGHFANCGAEREEILQVSQHLLDGATQGDILVDGLTYSCEIVRIEQ